MHFLKLFFNALVIIGLILLVARLVTVALQFAGIEFTTFFVDYSIPSLGILLVGALGSWFIDKRQK
ncbi:hypothetical protein BMT55_16255 [Listeria newyorkensis]|uniref:Uncharacterized protein n=2 Tax=Listeria TaxID=1637 RepID=A0A841YZ76_9LIST|nr:MULTISPECIES: hypothetical protein [Listeria]EUJ25767.1 hypothetical protein PCORN_16135 [Listeria cornellensis FSL F6-0969]KMT63255.1 hypothetical protein X559_0391 [Listeria newyorkensis]MBC1458834.1 hypothetical protein [Listeria newyorkensis]PNP87426.1 hypothetical protein BMT55_16255 [Listeria newyorkensis]RQW66942.1 hypothetical protein DUK53_09970 [Listeria sp. SHR_NRA_18]